MSSLKITSIEHDNIGKILVCTRSRFKFHYVRIVLNFSYLEIEALDTGSLHFFEHYLMTSKYNNKPFFLFGREYGIHLHAYTYWDRIEINIVTPFKYMQECIEVFFLHLQSLSFDESTLISVQKTVVNEIQEEDHELDCLNHFHKSIFNSVHDSILGSRSCIEKYSYTIIDEVRKLIQLRNIDMFIVTNKKSIPISFFDQNFSKENFISTDVQPIKVMNSFCKIVRDSNISDYFYIINLEKYRHSLKYMYTLFAYFFGDGTDLYAYFINKFREKLGIVYELGGIYRRYYKELFFIFHFSCSANNHSRIEKEINNKIIKKNISEMDFLGILRYSNISLFQILRDIEAPEELLNYLNIFGNDIITIIDSNNDFNISNLKNFLNEFYLDTFIEK